MKSSYYQSLNGLQKSLDNLNFCQTKTFQNAQLSLIYNKKVYVFLGFPGAGKTTQIALLQKNLHAPVFHMGTFAKQRKKDDPHKRKTGVLLKGLDQEFLDNIQATEDNHVIVDGFPRSVEQAHMLQAYAHQYAWNIEVVFFTFPQGTEVEYSYSRQVERAKKEKTPVDNERFLGKIARSIDQDLSALDTLRKANIIVRFIDATQNISTIAEEISENSLLQIADMSWERETLAMLEHVGKQTGISYYACAGMFYRPLWNGKYGPLHLSTDKDIFVAWPEERKIFSYQLEKTYPHIRWAVHSRQEESLAHFGISISSLEEGIVSTPLSYRQGGIRVTNGLLETVYNPQSISYTLRGMVYLDQTVLSSFTSSALRSEYVKGAVHRVHKSVNEYPGLTLHGEIKEFYHQYFTMQDQVPILSDWEEIQDAVWAYEEGGNARWNSQNFSQHQIDIANTIIEFYHTADKKLSAPPRPHKSPLPPPLEEARQLRNTDTKKTSTQLTSIPYGYSSWLDYVSREASDAEFREWFLNQRRSRKPIGGKDPDIINIFDFAKNEENRKTSGQQQKYTHMGLPLFKHLEESVLQLETDSLMQEQNSYPEQNFKHIRQTMRIAMMVHDMGKLYDVNTPGSHEGISKGLWYRLKPHWISQESATLIAWMIVTHDIFGRMARGLTEKSDCNIQNPQCNPTASPSYTGALDPQAVGHLLQESRLPLELATEIHTYIWKADVSSVSALRWLLPIVTDLKQLVLATVPQK